jgi:hypothetical protein
MKAINKLIYLLYGTNEKVLFKNIYSSLSPHKSLHNFQRETVTQKFLVHLKRLLLICKPDHRKVRLESFYQNIPVLNESLMTTPDVSKSKGISSEPTSP